MADKAHTSTTTEPSLDDVLADYIAGEEAGQPPNRDVLLAQHPHLARSGQDVETGQRDTPYVDRVGRRFAQWVLDTARAEFSQTWLDYQYEIGLRHHRTKKNRTDGAHSDAHVRGRDLIAFAAAIVVPMRPYLAMSGHPADVVGRMYDAWWKAVMLSVTLWSQPYMNPGDF